MKTDKAREKTRCREWGRLLVPQEGEPLLYSYHWRTHCYTIADFGLVRVRFATLN